MGYNRERLTDLLLRKVSISREGIVDFVKDRAAEGQVLSELVAEDMKEYGQLPKDIGTGARWGALAGGSLGGIKAALSLGNRKDISSREGLTELGKGLAGGALAGGLVGALAGGALKPGLSAARHALSGRQNMMDEVINRRTARMFPEYSPIREEYESEGAMGRYLAEKGLTMQSPIMQNILAKRNMLARQQSDMVAGALRNVSPDSGIMRLIKRY